MVCKETGTVVPQGRPSLENNIDLQSPTLSHALSPINSFLAPYVNMYLQNDFLFQLDYQHPAGHYCPILKIKKRPGC